MTTTPHPTEIRTMLEKAAKLYYGMEQSCWNDPVLSPDGTQVLKEGGIWDYKSKDLWNPATSAHDSRMLAIQAGITSHEVKGLGMEAYVDDTEFEAFIPYSIYEIPTPADKLQCELLAVLKCAAAIWDEREKL